MPFLFQILWTFSIYLESVAILPQLFMISKTGEAETITTHYLFFLGLYRALYLINWIWRFYFEGFFDLIAVVAGVVQTILYCDFFYLYITKGTSGLVCLVPVVLGSVRSLLAQLLCPISCSSVPQSRTGFRKITLCCQIKFHIRIFSLVSYKDTFCFPKMVHFIV